MTDTLSRPLATRLEKLEMPQFTPRKTHIPSPAKAAAIVALEEGKTHYTNRPGIVPLREWVTQHIKALYGLSLDKDEVTITCGIEEAIFACVMVLAENAILAPGDASHLHGAATLKDVPIIYSTDKLTDGTLIYLTALESDNVIVDILKNANPKTCWIVWDTTVGTVSTPAFHPAQNISWTARTISIGNTEDMLPGWRIGWMAGSSMAGKIRSFKQSMTICSPSISQWAAYGWADNS
ncbi:MAG: hypothetical protein ACPG7F_15635 [Aggregatilineales bacterium]